MPHTARRRPDDSAETEASGTGCCHCALADYLTTVPFTQGKNAMHAPINQTDGSKLLTLAAMSLGYGVVQLDVTIVNVATTSIGNAIGGAVEALQWVVSAYTIAFAAFILTAGALGDRIGAKRVFMAGFAIFTLASLACAVAPSLPLLIAARALQGFGAAVLVPNSLALLNHAYPASRSVVTRFRSGQRVRALR